MPESLDPPRFTHPAFNRTLTGKADPFATVEVFLDDASEAAATATADAAGDWSLTLTGLEDQHRVRVRQSDTDGNASADAVTSTLPEWADIPDWSDPQVAELIPSNSTSTHKAGIPDLTANWTLIGEGHARTWDFRTTEMEQTLDENIIPTDISWTPTNDYKESVAATIEVIEGMTRFDFVESDLGNDASIKFGYVRAQYNHAGISDGSNTTITDFFPGSQNPTPGDLVFPVLVHELGHTLGFAHAELDNTKTVMNSNYGGKSPHTLKLYDATALQFAYGVNWETNLGDTIHRYAPEVPVQSAIWDSGGNDTIDASGRPNAVTIDLTPGSLSSGLGGSVGVMPYTIIEHAVGSAYDDTLIGNPADNLLDGRAGDDSMTGGLGDDTYVVDSAGDVVVEDPGEGIDTVRSSITYTLSENLENISLTGAADIDGTGNARDNTLTGNAGINTLAGGLGDDIYVVDSGGDVVVEDPGEGTDIVRASVSYTLPEHVENLTLTGAADIDGTGNDLDNTLTGNAGINTLAGGLGDDTYVVDAGERADGEPPSPLDFEGSAFATSSWGTFTLPNASGWHTKNRGGKVEVGRETIYGGADADNRVLELAANDYDVNNLYTLVDNIERGDVIHVSFDASARAGFQSALDVYWEGTRIDTIDLGDDFEWTPYEYTLTATSDGDEIPTGNFPSIGHLAFKAVGTASTGALLDNIEVDLVRQGSDIVIENAGEGTDTVRASVSYTLPENIENVILSSDESTDATGNAADNVIRGNGWNNTLAGGAGDDSLEAGWGADVLDGGLGDDTLDGGPGDDVYLFARGHGHDTIVGERRSGGADTVRFADVLSTDELGFAREGDHLDVTITGTPDRLTVEDWYAGTVGPIETFATAGGEELLAGDIDALVQAMAA